MDRILLKDIYYCQNKDVAEYMDIFFETNMGILKNNMTSIDFVDSNSITGTKRLDGLDNYKEKYGAFNIIDIRITYDNNMYLLISDKFILAIEYVLNSNFKNSVQEFRVIEDIYGINKIELDDFKELDIVKLPSSP